VLVFSRVASLPDFSRAKTNSAESGPETRPNREPSPQVSAANPTERANPLETALIEAARGIHNYEGMEPHHPLDRIWVAGGTGFETELVKALASRLSLPCQLLDPGVSLGLAQTERQHASAALSALGLALGAQDAAGLPIDFLNPKRLPVERPWRRIKTAALVAAAGLILLAGWGVRSHLIKQRTLIRDQIQEQVNLASKNRALFRDLRNKAKLVNAWAREKKAWLDHYAVVSALLPPCTEVYVTSISTDVRGALHLSLQARNGDILAQIDQRLRAAGYDLKPLAANPGSDKYGYPFQSTLELILPQKSSLELTTLQIPPRPGDDVSLGPPRPRKKPEVAPAASPAPAPPPGATEPRRSRRRNLP
jgi:hypothetical protein